MYYLYKHIFPNNKIYIGITSLTPKDRWKNGNGYEHNAYMQNAIKKYKWGNVKHEILFDNLAKEQAEQKEIELIKLFQSNNRKYGYNIENGGKHQGNISEETKQKISKTMKEKKIYLKNKSAFKKGNVPWNKNKKGLFKMSEETKKKISLSHKKNPKWQYGYQPKKILCIETNKIYIGLKEASDDTKVYYTNIAKASAGKRKSAGGYHWKYIE